MSLWKSIKTFKLFFSRYLSTEALFLLSDECFKSSRTFQLTWQRGIDENLFNLDIKQLLLVSIRPTVRMSL
jgi:hypothetical protein